MPTTNSNPRHKNKPFENWTYEEVEDTFGLKRIRTHALLEEISKMSFPKNDVNKPLLEVLRLRLLDYVDSWNEDELKFMFISPFVNLVNYVSDAYKVFTQRPMAVSYENDTKTTSGKVEFMIAKGKLTPKKPFFFLHEYKQENRRANDPLGQLLIAMVAAQKQNADGETLYGCYVSGRSWFFVVLQPHEYAVSNAYNATDEDIFRIYTILLFFKQKTEERFGK